VRWVRVSLRISSRNEARNVSTVCICQCGKDLETATACVSEQGNYEEIKLFIAAAFYNGFDIKSRPHVVAVEHTSRQVIRKEVMLILERLSGKELVY
jgi:hypothetical protein